MSNLAGYEEEKLDQFLFRPLSQPVAVLAAKLGLTPNGVSLIGMLFGISAGYFFSFREASLVVWGVVLFSVRNIFDYADGQLARLTGKGTKYGYFFDGLCDYFAYLSVYLFAAAGLWPEYGAWVLPMVLAAGWSGGIQSALLDFYKREYRFWALGSDKDRFRSAEEWRQERASAKGFDRVLLLLAIRYAVGQERLTKSRRALFDAWSPHRSDPKFQERYSLLNRWPLKGLFLSGPNWHAYLFFLFGLLGRMEIFFLVQIVVLNAILAAAMLAQRACDRRLAREFPQEG
ncbi:MAG: CDP-alcohol phosphatidyltransferase family protein [Planctomycetota bacterium]